VFALGKHPQGLLSIAPSLGQRHVGEAPERVSKRLSGHLAPNNPGFVSRGHPQAQAFDLGVADRVVPRLWKWSGFDNVSGQLGFIARWRSIGISRRF